MRFPDHSAEVLTNAVLVSFGNNFGRHATILTMWLCSWRRIAPNASRRVFH
jgi:hypothetical protein